MGQVLDGGLHQRQPFGLREQRLFGVVLGDGHDDAVEQLGRTLDHVQMAVGQRIETAGIYRRAHEPEFQVSSFKFQVVSAGFAAPCAPCSVLAAGRGLPALPEFYRLSRWTMPVNDVPSAGLVENSSSSNGDAPGGRRRRHRGVGSAVPVADHAIAQHCRSHFVALSARNRGDFQHQFVGIAAINAED